MKIKDKQEFFEAIQSDCVKRRARLLRRIGNDGILFLSAAQQRKFSNDVEYVYRQDNNLFYVTGWDEDDAIAVLIPNHDQGDYLLFCRQSSESEMIWQGSRVGLRDAVKKFNAKKSYSIDDFPNYIASLLSGRKKVYVDFSDTDLMRRLLPELTAAKRGNVFPQQICSADSLLGDMRLIKSPLEKRLMRIAGHIAENAHLRAWRFCRPGVTEYEVEAELMYECHKVGAGASYPPIVAGGKNACILHYIKNNGVLKSGDLLLIDAGAEYLTYASDVTRTIPVNGRYSEPQKEVYEVVLEAQEAAIAKVKVGNTWNIVQATAERVITRGLMDIGLLRGNLSTLLKKQAHKEFFMHGVGHWLGMDVHDKGEYSHNGKPRHFEAGMVLTIEPGIYLRDVAKPFRNIGIRIEDDVLVTPSGPDVLTKCLPKEVSAIEKIMSS